MAEVSNGRWLLLIHQLPPKQDFFRVKIRRRLHHIGAAGLKHTVYVLPLTDQCLEYFQWVVQEIMDGGGTSDHVGPPAPGNSRRRPTATHRDRG